MKLDPRIKKDKRPLSCFDTEQAKEFLGKECYLSNSIADYADLNNVTAKRILDDVSNTSIPYSSNPAGIYCYCLPCEWVKEPEKKYREYKNLDEFFEVTGLEIGDLIKLKFPGNNVAELLIVGSCDNGLFIGIHKYTFKQLFEMVEISISGEWQPFGVMEDD